MSPLDAANLLELPAHATPAQIEARFRELRAVLEDKIAKALTPGLQEKYRASLTEITTAFEALILAADTGSLPGLSRTGPTTPTPRLPPIPATGSAVSSAALPPMSTTVPMSPRAIAPARKSSRKGLHIGLIGAIIFLGTGGWWVLKVQPEKAELARIAAGIKADTEHKAELARQQAEAQEKAQTAAAAKAERDKLDKQLAALRSRVAEIHASFDSANRSQLLAEKEIEGWKSQKAELELAGKTSTSPEIRVLSAKLLSRESYLARLTEILATHPAKAARLQVAETLTARSADAASTAIETYAKTVRQLQLDIGKARDELLVITGRLRVSSEPAGLTFTLTDAYGRTSDGRTPTELTDVPLGLATVTFQRPGWPDQTKTGEVTRAATTNLIGDLAGGALRLTSTPLSAEFSLTGQGRNEQGRTPATLPELPVGNYQITYTLAGWPSQTGSAVVTRGATAANEAKFAAAGILKVESKPAGATVTIKGQAVGTTPLVLPDLPPGPVNVELTLADYRPGSLQGAIESGKETALSTTLRPATLTPEEAFEKFAKDANGTWVHQGKNGLGGNATFYLRFVAGSKTLSHQMTGFGGSTRKMTMVDYDAENRIVLVMFGGLDALNGKIGLRIDGDTLLWGINRLSNPMVFRRQ